MIRIEPTRALRRDFARWAVTQSPKPRTVSECAFAVHAHLFATAPEEILIGALIDGHRYISPDEDTAQGRPAPGAQELLGVATEEGFTEPDQAAPDGASCPGCEREFSTVRGRDAHTRQVHGTTPTSKD